MIPGNDGSAAIEFTSFTQGYHPRKFVLVGYYTAHDSGFPIDHSAYCNCNKLLSLSTFKNKHLYILNYPTENKQDAIYRLSPIIDLNSPSCLYGVPLLIISINFPE